MPVVVPFKYTFPDTIAAGGVGVGVGAGWTYTVRPLQPLAGNFFQEVCAAPPQIAQSAAPFSYGQLGEEIFTPAMVQPAEGVKPLMA